MQKRRQREQTDTDFEDRDFNCTLPFPCRTLQWRSIGFAVSEEKIKM
jgi:hypothetical protein